MAPRSRLAVVIVGDEGYSLVLGKRPSSVVSAYVPAGDAAFADIVDWLVDKGAERIKLVSNQIGQSYAREDIPPASRRDRNAIVTRRLLARYGKEALTTSLKIEPFANEKTIDSVPYLFAALTGDADLHGLIDRFLEHAIDVDSVALLPLEWSDWLPAVLATHTKPADNDTWRVVVTRHRTGGIRHLVLQGERLILTRLTTEIDTLKRQSDRPSDAKASNEPADRGGAATAWASHIFQEIKASIGYIKRFGYTTDQPLSISLIGGPAFEQVRRFGEAGSNARWELLGPQDIAREFGLGGEISPESEFADALIGALLSTTPTLHPLTSPHWQDVRKRAGQNTALRISLHAASAALIAWLGWTGWELRQTLDAKSEAGESLNRLAAQNRQLALRTQNIPPNVQHFKKLLEIYEERFSGTSSFHGQFDAIRATIPDTVRLSGFSWTFEEGRPANLELELDLVRIDAAQEARALAESWLADFRAGLSGVAVGLVEFAVPIEAETQSEGSWSAQNDEVLAVEPKKGRLKLTISEASDGG